MNVETVRAFFDQTPVIEHYARAVNQIGLWQSEELLFTQYFGREASLLELGCGAGRISIGLWELGYRYLLATDLAKQMVAEGRRINQILEYGVAFQTADATQLPFEDNLFDGAIFGFNGLMQIPRRENRLRALREIRRVVAPGATFIFTTHDRENPRNRALWEHEKIRWDAGLQPPEVDEFGDLYWETPEGGPMFIHSPTRPEMLAALQESGWEPVTDTFRSALCLESERVRDFSDDCRFWIVRKPH